MLVDGNNMCLQFVHGNKGFVARDDVHEERIVRTYGYESGL